MPPPRDLKNNLPYERSPRKNTPKVSVIIPVYNTEMYLNQCLDSILNQTLTEIEIICVDDGSTDGSLEILKEYAAADSRVHILTQQNKYAGAARNYGMSQAAGEYLIFLDSDDFFEPDMLKSMYEKCIEDNAQICVCSGQVYDENTHKIREAAHYLNISVLPQKRPFSKEDISERIFNFTIVAPWNKMFRREFIEKNHLQFEGTKTANDVYFGNMSLALAERITVCNQVFVNYRSGQKSSLQATKDETPLDFYKALLKLQEDLKAAGIYSKTSRSFVNYCIMGCYYNLNSIKSGRGYSKIYRMLKEEGFERLGLKDHSRGYYYNKKYYYWMLDILNAEPEIELFDRLKTLESQKSLEDKGFVANESVFESIPLDGDIKVSVIIPVYNTERYIDECVESVINQSLKNIEIICVNDGSTDNSSGHLMALRERDPRIIILEKENGGQSSARNLALRQARGEYIQFLDSDDYLDSDTLKTLYLYSKYFNLDELFYNAAPFFDTKALENSHGSNASYYQRKGNYPNTETGRSLFVKLSRNGDFKTSGCLQFVRRGFLSENEITFREGMIHEDDLFVLQCISLAKRARVLETYLYHRRYREDSVMTGKKGIRHAEGRFTVAVEMLKFADRHGLDKYTDFYIALMERLSIECDSAADDVKDINETELLDYALGLDNDVKSLYMLLVYHLRRLRARYQKNADLKSKQDIDDLRKQLEIVKSSNERLKQDSINKNKKFNSEKAQINTQLQKATAENAELTARLEKSLAEKDETAEKYSRINKDKEKRDAELWKLRLKNARLELLMPDEASRNSALNNASEKLLAGLAEKLKDKTIVAWGGYKYFENNIGRLNKNIKITHICAATGPVDLAGYNIINKEDIPALKDPFVIISLFKDTEVANAAKWLKNNNLPCTHLSFLINPKYIRPEYFRALGGIICWNDNNSSLKKIEKTAQ